MGYSSLLDNLTELETGLTKSSLPATYLNRPGNSGDSTARIEGRAVWTIDHRNLAARNPVAGLRRALLPMREEDSAKPVVVSFQRSRYECAAVSNGSAAVQRLRPAFVGYLSKNFSVPWVALCFGITPLRFTRVTSNAGRLP